MDKYETWFGAGIKGGATVFTAGVEYVTGELVNAGFVSEWHGFQILSARVGVGLGASAEMTACFVFNCSNLMALNETEMTDWGVNLSFGNKWSDVVKALNKNKFIFTLASVVKTITKGKIAQPKQLETIRDGLEVLYNAYEFATMNGPKMIVVDIPGAGYGLEASAHYLQGTIEILN